MRQLLSLLGLVILSSGCKSDDAKLAQLEQDRLTACLVAERQAALVDSVMGIVDGTTASKTFVAELQATTLALNAATDRADDAEADRLKAKGASLIKQRNARTKPDTGMAGRAAYLAKVKSSGLDTLARQRMASGRRCELATREYNRFMR